MNASKRFTSWLLRIALALCLIWVTALVLHTGRVPRLAFSGLLGVVNVSIVCYLLLLSLRHFLLLFFAAREEVRRETLPEAKSWPAVSILVPAYNEDVVISRTIECLKELDYPEFEVIVIDDGSSDDTQARAILACAADARFRVVSVANGGKARALNQGLALARHDLVFCMDADSRLAPQSIRAGVRHFEDPAVGAVAGAVLILNAGTWPARFQTLEYLTGLNFYKSAQSYLGLVTIIPGPSGLFRKELVNGLGGYAPDTFAEDCDLTLRLAVTGARVVYEPLMEVRTEVPESFVSLIKQRYRWNRGILQATCKHLGLLRSPAREPVGFLVISYMFFESLILPVLNLGITLLSLVYTGLSFDFSLFSLWLLQLTLLDLSVLVFTLSDVRWPLWLVPIAAVNRFTYSFFLDIVKAISSVEELLGVRMTWGKLERALGGPNR